MVDMVGLKRHKGIAKNILTTGGIMLLGGSLMAFPEFTDAIPQRDGIRRNRTNDLGSPQMFSTENKLKQEQHLISGYATDALADSSLEGKIVELLDQDSTVIATAEIDSSGHYQFYETGIEEDNYAPKDFRLFHNYPDPFNPSNQYSI